MLRILDRIHELVFPFACMWTRAAPTQIFKPLPLLPLEIWLEIFQWSTYVYGSTTVEPMDPFTVKHTPTDVMGVNTPILSMRTKCALVRVCRSWRRIAIHILYQHIVIRSPSRAALILQVLRDSYSAKSNYGHWTRHIELYTHARGSSDIRFLQTAFRILQYCPRLRVLSATWRIAVPREFLSAVSTLYGPTLQGLYWNEQKHSLEKTHASLDFLASFGSLRILDLRHFVGDGILKREGSPVTLPHLNHIILSNQGSNISVATAVALPSLHTLTLQSLVGHATRVDLIAKLLAVHGASLVTIHLPSPSSGSDTEPAHPRTPAQHVPPSLFLRAGACPNLETLTFGANSPAIVCETSAAEPYIHPTLRRIALHSVRADALYPSKGPNETQTHLRSFTRVAYPALETVRTAGFLVDADTDSLVRDVFIWWGERFEHDGIDFQDGEGVVWLYADDGEGEASQLLPTKAVNYIYP
ncbi:hypothetical protein B0H17DRAFT_1019210 [Mycena rosella]|uniref:F-box domain-containing protein n=1 Tax=Mycena rosella TaxID=1033263 RepID=A0AAD7G800_MYCRO|nr:hypothetical protein B0H17DRAFT_1019210 [Mycena rosella]